MKPQKRFRFLIIALTATIFLSACKSSENNNSVSTAAKKIIQTIANCPNEEYYSTSDITAIGEGTDSSSESSETEPEPVDTYQNLKDTLGEYFTDTAFDAFYSQGIADKYFSDAFINNYEIFVQDIELVEKKDNSETVKVTLKKGSVEDTNTFLFTYDDDGLVTKIVITDQTKAAGQPRETSFTQPAGIRPMHKRKRGQIPTAVPNLACIARSVDGHMPYK